MAGDGIHVMVVPLPAQSHLNQLLHFSRVIAQRGATVTFISTSAHIHQVQSRVEGWELHNFNIHFRKLPMPHFSPGELDAENTPMFPLHFITLFEAVTNQLGSNVDQLLRTICCENNKRVVLVYDMTMGWVQTVATKYSIPSYIFSSTGAYYNLWINQISDKTRVMSPVNISLKRCFPEEFVKNWKSQKTLLDPVKGYIMNTFSSLESEFIQREREESVFGGKPVWNVGPLLPQAFFKEEQQMPHKSEMECMRWLDAQAPASVLYVSFGSMATLSASQIRKLADGLERSGQPFLWVLIIADGAHSSTKAQFDSAWKFLEHEGYERRLEGRGFIARNWAPQLDILFHKSTGGFFNALRLEFRVESISAGVGMITWPLHSDQFANSALITRELKAGIEVKEWQNADENEEVNAEEVEKAVKRLMRNEEVKVRKRTRELRSEAEKAVGDEGSSWKDIDSLLRHFSQSLCN